MKVVGGGALLLAAITVDLLEAFHSLEYLKSELPLIYAWITGATVQTGMIVVGLSLLAIGISEIRRLRGQKQDDHPEGSQMCAEQRIGGDVHSSPIIAGTNYGPITTNVIHQPAPSPQKLIDNSNPHCEIDWLTLTLHDLFMRDFTYTLRFGATWQIGEPVDIPGSKIEFAVPIDLPRRSRFLVFYVTLARDTFNLCHIILVSCPGHNVSCFHPSDNHETEPVGAGNN